MLETLTGILLPGGTRDFIGVVGADVVGPGGAFKGVKFAGAAIFAFLGGGEAALLGGT